MNKQPKCELWDFKTNMGFETASIETPLTYFGIALMKQFHVFGGEDPEEQP